MTIKELFLSVMCNGLVYLAVLICGIAALSVIIHAIGWIGNKICEYSSKN